MATQTATPETPETTTDFNIPDDVAAEDDLLLSSARDQKTAQVSGRITAFQSHQARAWTTSGSVD